MKKNMKKEVKKVAPKKGMSVGKKLAIGAGVVAVGAGAYMLLGKNGKANQKKVKVLLNNAKGMLDKKNTKIVIAKAKNEVKKEWVKILKQTKPVAKKVIKATKKIMK